MASTDLQHNIRHLKASAAIRTVNRFLSTPYYIFLILLLTALSNIFSLELPVYTIFSALAVYICFLADDFLPITPLVICSYIAPSKGNNPGNSTQSVFYFGQGGGYILILALFITAAILFRLIRDRHTFFAQKKQLLSGILILFSGYLLSGIGSDAYPASIINNLAFASLQGCSLLLPYWLLCGGLNWKHVRKDYFAWIGCGVGCLLITELAWIYCTGGVITDGSIDFNKIYTGWGMRNNIGGLLAMMIPFAFSLGLHYRKEWLGCIIGTAFLTGVFLSCSRSSILVGICIYVICSLLTVYYTQARKKYILCFSGILAVIVLFGLANFSQLVHLFSHLIAKGMDSSYRDVIYVEGLKLFAEYPIFGCSFFSPGYAPWEWSTSDAFSQFFPARWHNTAVQLLASCGIIGACAYLYHRIQTVRLFLQDITAEKTFIACSVCVLLVSSMLDCHFFNIGPALFYAMALAFIEKLPKNSDL